MNRCSTCAFEYCVDIHCDFNTCSVCLAQVCDSCYESSEHLNEYIHVDDKDLCDCIKDAWVCDDCFAGEDAQPRVHVHVFACSACPSMFCMACNGNTCAIQGCNKVYCDGCAAAGAINECCQPAAEA